MAAARVPRKAKAAAYRIRDPTAMAAPSTQFQQDRKFAKERNVRSPVRSPQQQCSCEANSADHNGAYFPASKCADNHRSPSRVNRPDACCASLHARLK